MNVLIGGRNHQDTVQAHFQIALPPFSRLRPRVPNFIATASRSSSSAIRRSVMRSWFRSGAFGGRFRLLEQKRRGCRGQHQLLFGQCRNAVRSRFLTKHRRDREGVCTSAATFFLVKFTEALTTVSSFAAYIFQTAIMCRSDNLSASSSGNDRLSQRLMQSLLRDPCRFRPRRAGQAKA